MEKVKIKEGTVKLRKPLAGERNKALMKAETSNGIKTTIFLVNLLPSVIVEHPFGAKPIKKALDSLEIDDYDNLIDGLRKLIQGDVDEDTEKKLEESSTQNDSQKNDGSETSS